MIRILIGLLTLCAMVMLMTIAPMRKFRAELALLPERDDSHDFQHPILGVNLPLLLTLPDEVKQQSAIVIFADPACRSCKGEMQDLIQARRTAQIPAVCYYEHERVKPEEVEEFLALFAGSMPLIPMRTELLQKLSISGTPFVFMIDEDGRVVRVQRPMKRLVEYFCRQNRQAQRQFALAAKEQVI